jgi:hypothetical protein
MHMSDKNYSMKDFRDLPDRTNCKIAKLGDTELCECLVSYPQSCKYATIFGYAIFCQHPDRITFTVTVEGRSPAQYYSSL